MTGPNRSGAEDQAVVGGPDATDTTVGFARLAERVVPDGRLLRCWPLEGGVSASVHGLEIAAADGRVRKVVIRRLDRLEKERAGDGALSREAALLQVLGRLGFAVPEVYLFDDSGEAFPVPYLAMEMIEGTTVVERHHLPQVLDQMAAFLARLHSLDLESSGLPPLPALENPAERLPDHLRAGELSRRICEVLPAAHERRNPPSLLHGDYWPGNVLWRDGRLAAVIDWEDATSGDPLSDLACCRVELLCQYGEAAMESFTSAYLDRAAALDSTDLPLWEVYVSAAALSSMAQWGLAPQAEAKRRARTEAFLERAARELLASLE